MSEISFASKVWGSGGEPAETPAADMNDAADFQRWMQEESPHSLADGTSHSALSTVLRSAAESLHEREREFDKTLARIARSGDPVDGLAVQRKLSELFLSHGLAVKVIGKTTQALETLSRLQ